MHAGILGQLPVMAPRKLPESRSEIELLTVRGMLSCDLDRSSLDKQPSSGMESPCVCEPLACVKDIAKHILGQHQLSSHQHGTLTDAWFNQTTDWAQAPHAERISQAFIHCCLLLTVFQLVYAAAIARYGCF